MTERHYYRLMSNIGFTKVGVYLILANLNTGPVRWAFATLMVIQGGAAVFQSWRSDDVEKRRPSHRV